jgi:hypothetical protein
MPCMTTTSFYLGKLQSNDILVEYTWIKIKACCLSH